MTIKKESGKTRQFSTGAKKQPSTGKGTPALFPGDAYLEVCKHFEDGAVLHGDRNWEKGIPLSELINSLERHIAQEKMGLTDEAHDRAIAWNAIVYLATKLRIKAGILPQELADIPSYNHNFIVELDKSYPNDIEIHRMGGYYYIHKNKAGYLWRDLTFHQVCCSSSPKYDAEGYYSTKDMAEKHLQKYLGKSTFPTNSLHIQGHGE